MSKLKIQNHNSKVKNKKLRKLKNAKEKRQFIEKKLGVSLENTGKFSFDEKVVSKKNCENLIGAAQVPLGIAGPLLITHHISPITHNYYIPLATTEGALAASVNRGCKAIKSAGGAVVFAEKKGATRGPIFETSGISESIKFKNWLEENFEQIAKASEKTSSHLKFLKQDITIVGRNVFARFYFDTQDAMGMNMVTIATQKIAELIQRQTGIKCLSVAGNFDIDKKPAWINFINNRGFKAWAEVVLPKKTVEKVLKTTPQKIFDTWLAKCMIGSAISGSIGFNAHYANIIAAIFVAAGQDPAHAVEGSLGITTIKVLPKGNLYFSVYLPALMVGTVGGGTGLSTQKEALEILEVAGGDNGKNAQKLAELTAGAVLAGELSLLASLAEKSLARAHKK